MFNLSVTVMDKVWNDQSLNHAELLQLQNDLGSLREMDSKDYKMIAEWAVAELLSNELTTLDTIESIQTGRERSINGFNE